MVCQVLYLPDRRRTSKLTIQGFRNPFTENAKDLCNIVTKAVMPDVRKDVVSEPEIGNYLTETFIAERLTFGKVNLWSPVKKRQLETWRSDGKKMKMTAEDKIVELQEDRSLFARMLVILKSRSEINLRETIATYEFSVVPRAMFAADGTILHCSTKSNLMAILEKLPTNNQETSVPLEDAQAQVAGDAATCTRKLVTDGMDEVQCFGKPDWVQNCSQLANCFTQQLLEKYHNSDEMHVVFDRYDVNDSLETFTRQKRQGGQAPIAYHVTDTTNIAKIEMKRLLSHTKTKSELTAYLAEKLLEKAHQEQKHLVVAWGSECLATHQSVVHLSSSHEEADTKMVLHALSASCSGATTVHVCSPDTDVLVLLLRRYPKLCQDTSFVTGVGQNHRIIKLGAIYYPWVAIKQLPCLLSMHLAVRM